MKNNVKIFGSIIFSFFVGLVLIFRRKNYIVITSYRNKKFNFNARIFFEFLLKDNQNSESALSKYQIKFVIDDSILRSELERTYGDHFLSSDRFKDLVYIHSARIWLTATRPIYPFPYIRYKRLVINLWHGIPIKKIGVEDQNTKGIRRLIYKYYYPFLYDYVCSSSDELVPLFAKSFNLPEKKVLTTGMFIGEMFDKSIDVNTNILMAQKLGSSSSRKILYAPTYRDGGVTKYFPFDNFKVEALEQFLEEQNLEIFIRPHHLDKGVEDLKFIRRVKIINSSEVQEIGFYLKHFDILITDYSSIALDYLLTEGKLLYLPYDLDVYIRHRGINFNFKDVSPGPTPISMNDFFGDICRLLNDPSYFRDERFRVKKYFHSNLFKQCTMTKQYILKFLK